MKKLLETAAAAAAFACVCLPAQAVPIFIADMSGTHEVPSNLSPATGFTRVTLDQAANTIFVDVTYSGLTGGTPAAAHIHCCVDPGSNVGVAVGFPGFPTTLSGSYTHLFDLTNPAIYTAAFRTNFGGGTAAGAEAALITGLFDGRAYSNIHNLVFAGGEIRGLLAEVPEPGTLTIFGAGLLASGITRRRRAKRALTAA